MMNNLWKTVCMVLSVLCLASSKPVPSNSINSNVSTTLEEILTELAVVITECEKQVDCTSLLVPIIEQKNVSSAEIKCRILKSLETLDEKTMNLTKLKQSIKSLVPEAVKCKVDYDEKKNYSTVLFEMRQYFQKQNSKQKTKKAQ